MLSRYKITSRKSRIDVEPIFCIQQNYILRAVDYFDPRFSTAHQILKTTTLYVGSNMF